ncbi:MAG: radical SAM protein [Methanosarcinaceae archaeon]|nr:radical SAM protein [Methanosarcinaceae archaeon]
MKGKQYIGTKSKFTYALGYYYNYFIKKPILSDCVYIEPTNHCNFRCIMCAREKMTRKRGYMDFDLYTHIIDDMVQIGIPNVKLQLYEESLLHPKCVEMVEYASKQGINISTTTNGELLSEVMAEGLMNAGIKSITISFHAGTPEDYQAVHQRDTFIKVIDNVKNAVAIRNKLGKNTLISVQSAIMEENKENFYKIASYFKDYCDYEMAQCSYNPHSHTHDSRVVKLNYLRKLPA